MVRRREAVEMKAQSGTKGKTEPTAKKPKTAARARKPEAAKTKPKAAPKKPGAGKKAKAEKPAAAEAPNLPLPESPVRRAFDEIADEWAEYRSTPTPVLSYFLSILQPRGIFLDAGCGNGRNSMEIAEKADLVIAVDFSGRMLDNAAALVKEKGIEGKVALIQGDVRRLPMEGGLVDSAFYLAVLHHLETPEDRRKAFAEMFRVLKPGGKAFVAVWNGRQKRFSKIQGPDALIAWKKKDGTVVDRFHHFFETAELEGLAMDAGLTVARVFYEKCGAKVGPTKAREAQNICMALEKPAVAKPAAQALSAS